MISELSTILADKGIKLSKPVREFCEACTKNNDNSGFTPQYKTLAEAWVHLVLIGSQHPETSIESVPSNKDPIKWRYIPEDWKSILLLHALDYEFTFSAGDEELGARCLRRLEKLAEIGAQNIEGKEA